MYRETNRQILEEVARLSSLKIGPIIGENASGKTTVKSLGKFYSNVLGDDLYVGLKEYGIIPENTRASSLNMRVACELGVIDLVEKDLPDLIKEFPLFHGLLLDTNKKPIGVITEDYSKAGTISVNNVGEENRDVLPYEIQKLLGKPKYPEDLATTCFIVDERRRIGDFGEFTMGNVMEIMKLSKDYINKIKKYSVQVKLEKQ